jgi:hypothetical protein|eukprot:COSAG01_NODE_2961_length_6792_cov_3.056178_3_plen_87_part_00
MNAVQGAAKGAVSQLKEVQSGTLGKVLRLVDLLCSLLSLGLAGVWHVIQIVTCSCTTDDPAEAGKVCECMDFFQALSPFFVAVYIM